MMPSPDEASPSVSPPPEPSTVEVPSVPVLLPCVSLIASFDAPSPTPSSASPIIGSVSSPISPLSPSGAVPYKRRALPLANLRIDGRGGVRGVAEFRGQLFVVVESSDVVHVYSRTQTISCPYVRSDPFRVKGLKSPTDVVACRDTEQLYVADGAKRCVWRIDTKTITQRQSAVASDCWLKTPDFEPQTLSVRMRRVVVTSEASAWLHLYRTDGKLVKRIPLPDGTAALHAVETDRETFVVSLVRRGVKSRCQVSLF